VTILIFIILNNLFWWVTF